MPTDTDDPPASSRWSAICPHCAGENAFHATMCRHCLGPLMSMQNNDPFGSISARGDAFTKAANGTSSPIVLIGMWLIFAPTTLLWIAIFSANAFSAFDSGQGIATALLSLLPSLFCILPIAILTRTTRNFFRTKSANASRTAFPVQPPREK